MNHNTKTDSQFRKMLQIGIIVRNVDAAVKAYEEKYGFGPWKIETLSNRIPPFIEMTLNGEYEDFEIKTAFCNCFGMEFELIEPISDSVYKTWLKEHGPGIHHLAFLTKKEYKDLLKDHQEETGKKPWIRGECPTIGMDFSYLDFREELGFIAEVYGMDKENVPGNEF